MKKLFALALMLGFVLTPVFVKAEDQAVAPVIDAVAVNKPVEVGNKICPISGEKIGNGDMGKAVKQEYKGKIYNLCCGMCPKDFNKDPDKYAKIAEDEVNAQAVVEAPPTGQQ